MSDQPLDVVVLAGGKNSVEMEAATGVTNRALVPLGDRTMLDYVIDALKSAHGTRRVFVVGDVPDDNRYQRVPPGQTLMDNLLAGLRAAGPDTAVSRVLVTTSDTPFLGADAIDDFLTRSLATGGDLCYPIVPIALCREKFPEMKRTTLRLREGTFTGGNMMLLNPRFILTHKDTILRAYAARKSVPQIGRLLGWGLLVRILFAQAVAPNVLTLGAMESGVSRLIGAGCRARAVVTQYPEIGTDVDKPEDVVLAKNYLHPD
jgi:CTP:molybdopterin cytidylyltransferase MocA